MTPPELVSVTVLTCRRAVFIDDLTFPTFLKRSQTKMDVTRYHHVTYNNEQRSQTSRTSTHTVGLTFGDIFKNLFGNSNYIFQKLLTLRYKLCILVALTFFVMTID